MINTFFAGKFSLISNDNNCNCFYCYAEKLAEATRKYASMKSELAVIKQNSQQEGHQPKSFLSKRSKQPTMKLSDLKLAFSEFYLSLILLQSYQTLNFTGFRKILKKHDKVIFALVFIDSMHCRNVSYSNSSSRPQLVLNGERSMLKLPTSTPTKI